jgi:hypothetical protein
MGHGQDNKPKNRRAKLNQLIHIGRCKLSISEDAYRALLQGVCGKASCSDMTIPELEQALKAIKAAGFKVDKKLPLREEEIGTATPGQLSYIKGMWELAARVKTEKALNAFIRRIAHCDSIRFLDVRKAKTVILALRDMMARAGFDPDGIPQEETWV